ncbi:STAS domain-containing protein [Streptomyces lacrimifluminis]|uniref:Anti-sigma factor antagonist n=1 Tax=Streptomyces lacrimifluminis TaxID=1500077 RepID=A0A917NSA8_9ACTN|nr:anti-sigma factor antagonist [Streptomyces lacrimifluminis]
MGQPGAVMQYDVNGIGVVVAYGEYDAHTLGQLSEALHNAAAKQPCVVLDVSAVTFGDSSFLNLLLTIRQQASFRLVSPPPQLRRVLEITGADTVLDIRASVEDATSD